MIGPQSFSREDGNARNEWAKSWHLPLLSMLGLAVAAMHTYALGALIPAIHAATGWTRSQISIGPVLVSTTSILIAPFLGVAIDRFGSRTLALFGLALHCSALAALGFTGPREITWIIGWAFVGLTFALVSPPVWTAPVVTAFHRSRGKAIGVALAGLGVSAICLPFVATVLQEHYGWRSTYRFLGGGGFVMAFPLVWLFFRDARGRQERPSARLDRATLPGMPVRNAFLSRRYLQMAVAVLLASTCSAALAVHFVPIVRSNGLSPHTAAAVAAGIGLSSVTGRLVGGYLLDRTSGPLVGFVSCACGALIAPSLLLSHGVGAGLFGACMLGLSAGMEIGVLAFLVPHYFGLRHYGLLFAVMGALVNIGLGLGPFVAGYLFDRSGDYRTTLLLTAPLYILGAILFGTLGRSGGNFPALSLAGASESRA